MCYRTFSARDSRDSSSFSWKNSADSGGQGVFYGFTRRGYHAAAGWGLQWTGTTFVCACPIGECAGQSISRGVVLRTRLS